MNGFELMAFQIELAELRLSLMKGHITKCRYEKILLQIKIKYDKNLSISKTMEKYNLSKRSVCRIRKMTKTAA